MTRSLIWLSLLLASSIVLGSCQATNSTTAAVSTQSALPSIRNTAPATQQPTVAPKATPTDQKTAPAQRTIDEALVDDLQQHVSDVRPILLPQLPPSFSITQLEQSRSGFSVQLTDKTGQEWLRLSVMIPNPPLPTAQTQQSHPRFRTVSALYQVEDRRQERSERLLLWDEPGRWKVDGQERASVTYYVQAHGMTDKEFWLYANALRSVAVQ